MCFSYIAVGVAPFDSIAHAMTTVATGGFSPSDESIGYYQSFKGFMGINYIYDIWRSHI